MKKFEVVLPCYNEEKSVQFLLDRAVEAARSKGMNEQDFGLIMVENGSRDGSRKLLLEFQAKPEYKDWFKLVPIDVNRGYGYGITQGMNATTAPIIGWTHSDQQCDPLDCFKAYDLLLNAKDPSQTLVKGVRFGRDIKERFVSRVFEIFALFILGKFISEINAQPKVFKRDLWQLCSEPPEDFSFDLYVLYVALVKGYRIQTLAVKFPPRIHGFSNWASNMKSRNRTIRNMIRYMFVLRRKEIS